MLDIPSEKFNTRIDQVPEEIRDIFFSEKLDNITDALEKECSLNVDQWFELSKILQYVVLGFISSKDLFDHLKKIPGLNQNAAVSIYQKINSDLLASLQQKIDDNYLVFRLGVVDDASVQTPQTSSSVNLKAPQASEGSVLNLRKESNPSQVISFGSASQAPTTSFSSQVSDQKISSTESAPAPESKKLFELSTKDKWDIQKKEFVAAQDAPQKNTSLASADVTNKSKEESVVFQQTKIDQPSSSPMVANQKQPPSPDKIVLQNGPVIIHTHDDSVAASRPTAQFRDFSWGGFRGSMHATQDVQSKGVTSSAQVQIPQTSAGDPVRKDFFEKESGQGENASKNEQDKKGFFSLFNKQ